MGTAGTKGIAWEWTRGGSCAECRKPFEGPHLVSKTTCDAKCRKRRSRRLKETKEAPGVIMSQLQLLRDAIKRHENTGDHTDQLLRIQAEVRDLLLLAKEPEAVAQREMLAGLKR